MFLFFHFARKLPCCFSPFPTAGACCLRTSFQRGYLFLFSLLFFLFPSENGKIASRKKWYCIQGYYTFVFACLMSLTHTHFTQWQLVCKLAKSSIRLFKAGETHLSVSVTQLGWSLTWESVLEIPRRLSSFLPLVFPESKEIVVHYSSCCSLYFYRSFSPLIPSWKSTHINWDTTGNTFFYRVYFFFFSCFSRSEQLCILLVGKQEQ